MGQILREPVTASALLLQFELARPATNEVFLLTVDAAILDLACNPISPDVCDFYLWF